MERDYKVIFEHFREEAQAALNQLGTQFGREAAIARIDSIRIKAAALAAELTDKQKDRLRG